MGLEECSDRLIGNWHLRGVSGGEKKRVSIALEILTRPNLLFLDEPTSGLDSASAFFVIQTLRNVARDGRTVVSSIHQPSSEVFALFDDLFLLSGGESIYFGEAKRAVQVWNNWSHYKARIKFECGFWYYLVLVMLKFEARVSNCMHIQFDSWFGKGSFWFSIQFTFHGLTTVMRLMSSDIFLCSSLPRQDFHAQVGEILLIISYVVLIRTLTL